MSFVEAVRSVYGKYATFSGRAPWSEYWWFQLFWIAVYVGIYIGGFLIAGVTRSPAPIGIAIGMVLVFVLASFIPNLAVTVRRLHDSDKSGWWLLLVFIPFGGLVLLIFMLLDSNLGFNRYGPPHGELPGDAHVKYYGATREEAWSKFTTDAADAAAAGYQAVSQRWQPYIGGQELDVTYRGRPPGHTSSGPGQTPRWS